MTKTKLTRQDFTSDQEVRWCPGCGDYAILANMQRVMPELGIPKENIVFVSGIGCASRFPYYMDTYGFHTIHGRAPAVATGLKLSRPELSVWIVTGDGDGLSIGANHLIHLLRRNLDVNVLLFNNRIYGLTKGQYSPTSEVGKITKSTPNGSIDRPIDAVSLALASQATFVARCFDVDAAGLQSLIKAANQHNGTSFIEIYQNCNVFNDKAFAHISDRDVRADKTVWLEAGKPLLFGNNNDKGLVRDANGFSVIDVKSAADLQKVYVHEPRHGDSSYAFQLSQLSYPDFPVPMGILRQVEQPTYENCLQEQVDASIKKNGQGDLQTLLNSGTVWEM